MIFMTVVLLSPGLTSSEPSSRSGKSSSRFPIHGPLSFSVIRLRDYKLNELQTVWTRRKRYHATEQRENISEDYDHTGMTMSFRLMKYHN